MGQRTEQFDALPSVLYRDEPPGNHAEPKSKKQSGVCDSVWEKRCLCACARRERMWVKVAYSGKLLREFSQIGEKYNFCKENVHVLLAFAVQKDAMPKILWRKLLQIRKIHASFLPWKFSACCMQVVSQLHICACLCHLNMVFGHRKTNQWVKVVYSGKDQPMS